VICSTVVKFTSYVCLKLGMRTVMRSQLGAYALTAFKFLSEHAQSQLRLPHLTEIQLRWTSSSRTQLIKFVAYLVAFCSDHI